jgi:hypothetical protein
MEACFRQDVYAIECDNPLRQVLQMISIQEQYLQEMGAIFDVTLHFNPSSLQLLVLS